MYNLAFVTEFLFFFLIAKTLQSAFFVKGF